jgi:hypothetical protein
VVAFVFAGLFGKYYPRWLVYAAGACVLLSVAVSGSRTTVFGILIVASAVAIIWLLRPAAVGRLPAIAIGVLAVCLIVQELAIFKEGIEVLQTRSEQAFASEGFLERLAYTFMPVTRAPLLGVGLGIGTNVGSALLTGELTFLLAEGEWPRVILESGPILGGGLMFWRLALIVYLARKAYPGVLEDNFAPWLLAAAAAPLLLTGNFGQPTSLGFGVFIAGLSLAALNAPSAASRPSTPVSRNALPPGRSAFAERLHGG